MDTAAPAKSIQRADGKVWTFAPIGNAIYEAPPNLGATLVEQPGTTSERWLLTTPEDVEEAYDQSGRLVRITSRAGQTIYVNRDGAGRIQTVVGSAGRTLTFVYDVSGRIASITGPANQTLVYAYDVQGNLAEVAYPDETPTSSIDNPTRQYHYEDASYPDRLTGITDENGNRYATFGYDADGLADMSEHAGSVDRVDVVRNGTVR